MTVQGWQGTGVLGWRICSQALLLALRLQDLGKVVCALTFSGSLGENCNAFLDFRFISYDWIHSFTENKGIDK